MPPISVIIPSYRNPEYLDLCLRSAYSNQTSDKNQIIVVLDGHAELSADVVAKYPNLDICAFEENKGQTAAHNTGVILAEHERILIVNDDNVFPERWDERLCAAYEPRKVITPNQIEPAPSIFKSFVHNDLGRTAADFRYDDFLAAELVLDSALLPKFTDDGQTWPVFMNKKYYMAIGGIDPAFPSPAVADWDFFMRLELLGLEMVRYRWMAFYHFAGAATKRVDMVQQHNLGEQQSFAYFAWKWGFHPSMSAKTHSKFIPDLSHIRGVDFHGP